MKPKKLIRSRIPEVLQPGEWEVITDKAELNKLYVLKIREELAEVVNSGFNDLKEFADLVEIAVEFAHQNGFDFKTLHEAMHLKQREKGYFGKLALNNLNPNNPSNALYFREPEN